MSNLEFYKETLKYLNKYKVEYLIVGGYAVNSYGFMRSTGDMDLWINIDDSNLVKLSKSLSELNYPSEDIQNGIIELKESKNINLKHGDFFKIEFISFLSTTLTFGEAFKKRSLKTIFGFEVPVVDFDHLCDLKLRSGRNKDLMDVKELKRIRGKAD